MISTRRTTTNRRNAGFTLVELLVVIAIIAVLAALTAGAVFKVIAVQQSSNTTLTVKTLSSLLDKNWAAVVREHQSDPIPLSVAQMAGNDDARARVIWIYLNLKREFPVNLTETLTPWDLGIAGQPIRSDELPAKPGYLAAWQRAKQLSASFVPNKTDAGSWPSESAFTLVMALQQNRGGSAFAEESFAANALATEIFKWQGSPAQPVSPPGFPPQPPSPILSGPKMVVDAWTVPLRFYRFPVGNPDIQSSMGASIDPLDPLGTLVDPRWNNATNFTAKAGVWWFEKYCHTIHTVVGNTYKPISFKFEPVIVSAGPDHLFGYQDTTSPNLPDEMNVSTSSPNDWFDNVASYKLRLGATGDK